MRTTLAMLLIVALSQPAFGQKAKRTSETRAAKQDLLLIQGLQSTLDLMFEPCSNTDECVRVANKGLVTVQYSKDKKQLIFTPLKRGETTVTVRDDKGDIRLIIKSIISENNLSRRFLELKELLRDIEGIEIKVMADKIILDGEVVVVNDLNRLYAVIADESYKGIVLNLVGVSPVALQILAERIQSEINKPNIKVRVFNNLFLIEGQVDSAPESEQVLNICRNMLAGFAVPKYNADAPSSSIDLKKQAVKDPCLPRLSVAPAKPKPPDKMLRITIDFVELSKDYFNNFGFSWIPSLDSGGSIQFGQSTTGGVTTAGNGSLAGTIGNLFPKLASAQDAGYARILEEAVLIGKSGTRIQLERNLEIPIATVNERGSTEFKKADVGPKITIEPRVQGQTEEVQMNVDFGYAGFAGRQANAPIILKHGYKATVVVKSGESAAIVNAISNVINTSFNRDLPGGTQPPNPLFKLLRSKSFQRGRTQFVVFLTPQIIESSSSGTDDIKSKYGVKRKQ